MKNALIDPNESPTSYISGWTTDTPPEPIWTSINNSCRVCEVSDNTFEVAPPLFWTECEDNVVADQWYYDTQSKEIIKKPDNIEPPPELILNVTETVS
jgi:hypothetical protein